ncbi:MAG: MBL fold metallo-hydrolase [Rhodospirillaceae bacterium]|nr:MBL fold metallo-hydrolase [Rhodospirillaceae bacterium]
MTKAGLAASLLLAFVCGAARAQDIAGVLSPNPKPLGMDRALAPAATPCPDYKSPAIQEHIDKAYALIGRDLPSGLIPNLFLLPRRAGLCAPARVPVAKIDERVVKPTKLFDQLSYIGDAFVGVWVLKTSGGLILFDAMNNPADVDNIIEPGLTALGFNPADIKYILLTHGHADHWGGGLTLQERYKAKLWVGDKDASLLEPRAGQALQPPKADKAVADGDTLTLGDTTVKLYVTSGHTPGSLSAIFPVTDNGVAHKVAVFGGYGLPIQLEPGPGQAGLLTYIKEAERFRGIGQREGVDVALSTHPIFDDTVAKIAAVTRAKPTSSPWVLGREGWLRFTDASLEVARTVEAMVREKRAAPK